MQQHPLACRAAAHGSATSRIVHMRWTCSASDRTACRGLERGRSRSPPARHAAANSGATSYIRRHAGQDRHRQCNHNSKPRARLTYPNPTMCSTPPASTSRRSAARRAARCPGRRARPPPRHRPSPAPRAPRPPAPPRAPLQAPPRARPRAPPRALLQAPRAMALAAPGLAAPASGQARGVGGSSCSARASACALFSSKQLCWTPPLSPAHRAARSMSRASPAASRTGLPCPGVPVPRHGGLSTPGPDAPHSTNGPARLQRRRGGPRRRVCCGRVGCFNRQRRGRRRRRRRRLGPVDRRRRRLLHGCRQRHLLSARATARVWHCSHALQGLQERAHSAACLATSPPVSLRVLPAQGSAWHACSTGPAQMHPS